MNKYLLYFTASIIILGLASGCNPMQNPVVPAKNRSSIKSEKKWNCDINTGAQLNLVSYKEYDRNGNLIIYIEYTDAGSAKMEKSYTYSNNTSQEKIIVYSQTGLVDSIKFTNYELDNNGNIMVKINLNTNGDTISLVKYTYNDKGYLIKETEMSSNGNVRVDNNYSYTFNNNGDVVERLINYDTSNGSFQAKDSIVYRADNQAVERIYIDSLNNTEIAYTYFYNQAGKITQEIQKDNVGEVVKRYKYEYQYY